MDRDKLDPVALDRWITGNYGDVGDYDDAYFYCTECCQFLRENGTPIDYERIRGFGLSAWEYEELGMVTEDIICERCRE